MELVQQNFNDNFIDHASNSPPSSSYISGLVGTPQLNPRVGHEYQVGIPSIIKQSEQLQLIMNPADLEVGHDNSLSFAIGLPISVTWIHNEVENSGHEEFGSLVDYNKELKPDTFQSMMTCDNNSSQWGKRKNYALVPYTLSNSWNDTNAKCFLLGLYIFGKNFVQIKGFLEDKGMGEIHAFYYGKFYKSNEYRRWSDCRKIKGRKSMIGQKLFTGPRLHELLSRLIPHVSEESKDILLQVSKSYTEGKASLEEYVSSLKSIVGLSVLVEAVGIGKKMGDLTCLVVEPGKNNRVFSTPTCKSWSSLEPSDILNFLTGFRLSKAKSNDLFWEAVWPRLLARGWHSEQPKSQAYFRSKDHLVFLIPGVKEFSRTNLVKGYHYFDSISDVLSKVVAEPNLLDLEEAKADSCNNEEPERGSNKDDQSDYHPPTHLKPQSPTSDIDHMNFTVIDTSLVNEGKSYDLREFKFVPIDSVGEVKVNVADTHNKDISENIDQKLTNTNMFCEGKLLKVKELKYLPVEMEDASNITSLLRKSNGNSYDDSLSVVEANMLIYDKRSISNIGNQINAKKMVESLENQKTFMSNDNELKRTIKHQFSQRARSNHSNHAVLTIQKRRLTTCSKTETGHIIENSSQSLGSTRMEFSRENFGDPVSCQKNGRLIPSPTEKSVEDNSQESILNEICQHIDVSCDKVEKCESQSPVTFNIPQVPLSSKNGEMMETMEEPPRIYCDVGSIEQRPTENSRRQSTRNRSLSRRALESIANELLHGEKRQKRKHIQTQNDTFNICGRARTRGKMAPHRRSSDHGDGVFVEEKHLSGD